MPNNLNDSNVHIRNDRVEKIKSEKRYAGLMATKIWS
jgi:hypothetical protein